MTASSIGTYLDITSAALGQKSRQEAEPARSQEEISAAAQVLAQVIAGKTTVEEISAATGLDANTTLAALVALSKAGVVELTIAGAEMHAAPSESITGLTSTV